MPITVFPSSVGGSDDFQASPRPTVKPIEERAASLVHPASVGGDAPPAVTPEPVSTVPLASSLEEIGASEQLRAFTIPAFLASVGAMFTFQDNEVGDILKDQFPGTKIEPDVEGNLVATFPGGKQFAINKPGISGQDIVKLIGSIGAFTPAAKAATIGKTLGQKVIAGVAGAGATEAAIQTGQEALGAEFTPSDVALSAGLGGAAEVVVPAVQTIRQGRQARQIGAAADDIAQVAPSVQAAREATEETGIPLFQAQQTGVPAQLEKQSFVAQLPAGTRSAVEGLKTQNKAAGDAVENFINSIAPPEAVITGADKVRTAAETAIKATVRARKEASSPIYKQAFRRQRKGQLDDINTDALKTKISQMAKQFSPDGEIAKNLNSSLKKITNAGGNLQKLHLAKTEIDQTINAFGADSVGNTTKRFMTDIKKDLTDELVKQSPSYRAARDEFIRLSPEVTKIQESIIGKIAALDDTQLKQVSSKLFDAAETNPQVILKAKKAITDVDPEAWSQIIRVELEKRLGLLKSGGEDFSVENIPGQLFRALFPNDKNTKVLMNALDADQKKNLTFLKTALGRAKQGRPGGSQTAAREEIKAELKGGVVQGIRKFFDKPISSLVGTGVSTLTGASAEAAFNSRVAALSKALYDPTWKAEMKQLRALDPNSPAAGRALTQLLDDITITEENE